MAKIAIIETKPSKNNYKSEFGFHFERFALCSDPSVKTVRIKDVDIEFNPDDFDWVILVGKDAFKYYTKKTAITDYSGKVVDKKFLPIINPAMIRFKPEAEPLWIKSREAVKAYVSGELNPELQDISRFPGIESEEVALSFIQSAIDHPNKFCAMDSETTALYPRDGYLLGISLSYKKDWGAYISADCITEAVTDKLQELVNKKTIVFHNAKFDIPFIELHLGIKFRDYEDTMLLHYALEENPGTHGLKQLALKYTKYGDYEQKLYQWMDEFRSKHGTLKADFQWEWIPFEVMVPYAATDAVVTLIIFSELAPIVHSNPKLSNAYKNLLIPASTAIIKVQDNGVPFDKDRLAFGQRVMAESIQASIEALNKFPEVRAYKDKNGEFNPNSPKQLRELLFTEIGLKPTGKRTGTNAHSTDAEVLKMLSDKNDIPKEILNIRKKSKLKNTYLDKIIANLNSDNRLRTNFNIHGTVAGRLSSSGKLNMQQLPRDGSVVKGSIKARPGYKIVSMDLQTAEVYVAAVLSGDKALQRIFIDNDDFHSSIAKISFRIDAPVEEIKSKFPDLRQAAKAVTFGILYQAGAPTVADTINKDAREFGLDMHFTLADAREAIDNYFKKFPKLKTWLEENKNKIGVSGYTYSHFGRKRRLPNVKSDNNAVRSHAIRSGLNFLVQSPASDVNLLACIDMVDFIEQNKWLDAKIFALVHDSILAEVKEDQVEEYCNNLRKFVQKDRGISIPGSPIKCDFEVGDDYSFGKFDKEYGELFQSWRASTTEYA